MSLHILSEKQIKDNIPIGLTKQEKYICYNSKKEKDKREISNVENTIIPYLDEKSKQRSAIFISGISGSGKSTVCKEILDNVKPKRILLFTTASNLDPVYEAYQKEDEKFFYECQKKKKEYTPKFIQINLKQDECLELLTVQNLANSTCIFDDFQILDKKRYAVVESLLNDCLENGRKLNIRVITIVHQSQNYNKTRNIIFESDTFVLFPWTNQNAVKKFLTSYGDMSKDEIEKAISESSEKFDRLIYHKSYPRYIQTKNKIYLL